MGDDVHGFCPQAYSRSVSKSVIESIRRHPVRAIAGGFVSFAAVGSTLWGLVADNPPLAALWDAGFWRLGVPLWVVGAAGLALVGFNLLALNRLGRAQPRGQPASGELAGIQVAPKTNGFTAYLRVSSEIDAETVELVVDELAGLTLTDGTLARGPGYLAWVGPQEGVPEDLRNLRQRVLLGGGYADIVLLTLWGWPQSGAHKNLFRIFWADRAWEGDFYAIDDDDPRLTMRVRLLSRRGDQRSYTFVVRGGHGHGGLWIEDDMGQRLAGQPRPSIEVTVADTTARLRVTNHGDSDRFRLKVAELSGTGEREDPYHLPWRLTGSEQVTLDSGESDIVNVVQPNATDDYDALKHAGAAGSNVLRFYTASGQGWFDRVVSREQEVRMKIELHREREDAPPIAGVWIVAFDRRNAMSFVKSTTG
jgi:hypothetical protein